MATRRAPAARADDAPNATASSSSAAADVELERAPIPGGDDDRDDAPAVSEEEELAAIIANARDESPKPPRSTISRIDPETGAKLYLTTVATELVSNEWIARKFGGGKYHARHRAASNTGAYQYVGHTTYDVDPSVKPVTTGHELGAAVDVTPDALMSTGLLNIVAQMNAQSQLTIGMVKQISEGQQRRGPSWLEIVAAVGPILAPIIQDILKNRQDPTAQAIKLAELLKPAAPAAAGSADVLSALEKGIAIASRLGNRGGDGGAGGDSIIPLVTEGVRGIATIATGIMQERTRAANAGQHPHEPIPQQPVRQLSLVNGGAPAPASPVPSGGLPVIDRPWLAAARPLVPMLLQAARFMGPDAAAVTIARNLSDEQFNDLLEDIEDDAAPGFGGRLTAAIPAVAQIPPEWFGELVQQIHALAEDDDGTEAGASSAGVTDAPPAAS